MAPTIALRNKEDDSADLQTHHKTRMVWVIVTVVLVSLAFLTVVVIVTFRWYKARNQKQAATNNSPYMSKKDVARRRNMSDLDRMEEDELQRQFMIRKSLASRTSFRTDSRLCQSLSEEPLDMADDESLAASLKSDWKEFEANLHRERTLSFDKHPAEKPPRTSTGLTVPTPARSESPSLHYHRTPPPRSSASPALPRIPSEESLNLKTPRLSCSSTASTSTRAGSHWDKSRIIVIGYDRLESSED